MSAQSQFIADWNAAQERYRASVNAGYDAGDAEQMYLTPVKDKWDILKSVNPSMRQQAASELDAAQLSFLKGMQSGYKSRDAQNLFLKPSQQKWQAASNVQVPEDPMIERYKSGALTAIENGATIDSVMQAVPPPLLEDKKFVAELNSTAEKAFYKKQQANQREQKTGEKQDSPDALLAEYSKLGNTLKNSTKWFAGTDKLPDDVNQAIKDRMNQVASKLPAAIAKAGENQPSATDIISQQHPSWTAAQVQLAAEGKLKGATDDTLKIFTDKTGQRYVYKGDATDPSTDKNPDNWQLQ
jgi:hypothetical protein